MVLRYLPHMLSMDNPDGTLTIAGADISPPASVPALQPLPFPVDSNI